MLATELPSYLSCSEGARFCSHHVVRRGLLFPVVTAIIAVVGTVLGSVMTNIFQRRSAELTLMHEFEQKLRAERLAAYSGLISVLTDYRRAQLQLIRLQLEVPERALARQPWFVGVTP